MPSTLHCLVVDDDNTAREVLTQYVKQNASLRLAGTAENAIEAANVLQEEKIDLLLLDVEMPGMSGLELVENLSSPAAVVLVTGSEDYAVDAFDLDVTDYLVKPVQYGRFLKAVDRARDELADTAPVPNPSDVENGLLVRDDVSSHAFLKVGDRLVRVAFTDIQFIEAKGDYMLVQTEDDQHMIHSTMKDLEERLPSDEFMRVHRSFLVRIDHIDEIDGDALKIGPKKIPIGPSYQEDLIDRIQTL